MVVAVKEDEAGDVLGTEGVLTKPEVTSRGDDSSKPSSPETPAVAAVTSEVSGRGESVADREDARLREQHEKKKRRRHDKTISGSSGGGDNSGKKSELLTNRGVINSN